MIRFQTIYKYYFLFVSILLAFNWTVLNISDLAIDVLMIGYIVIGLFQNQWVIKKTATNKFIFKMFCLPWIYIMLYSVLVQYIQSQNGDYIQRSITLCLRMIIYFLFYVLAYIRLGNKIVQYFLTLLAVAYFPKIFQHFSQFGILRGIKILFSGDATYLSLALEINRLTYLFGMIGTYYFFLFLNKPENKAQNKKLFIISYVLMFIGVKRIAYVAVIASVLIIVSLSKLYSNNVYKISRLLSWGLCAVAYLYILFIHNGIVESLLLRFNINSMGRIQYWTLFSNLYSMLPTYLGRGISFAQRVVRDPQYIFASYKYAQYINALHNDVLAIYMGLGFCGAFLYWIWFFVIKNKAMGKYSYKAAIFSVAMSCYFFVLSTACNTGLAYSSYALQHILTYIVFDMFLPEDNVLKIEIAEREHSSPSRHMKIKRTWRNG